MSEKGDKYYCWNCNHEVSYSKLSDLFCASCNKLQPPLPVSHFDRLGLNISYQCGINSIEQAYYAAQINLHPDKFINSCDKEKQFSAQQTMSLNESYKILKNPLKRAEYLLELNNIIVNKDGSGLKPSQELLIESLESRATLDETDEISEVHSMAVQYTDLRIKMIDEISEGFKENNLGAVAKCAMRLRYLEKLIEEIKLKENKLKKAS